MQNYLPLSKKGEGSFSVVLEAQHVKSKRILAIKCMKEKYNDVEQVQSFVGNDMSQCLCVHAIGLSYEIKIR